MRNWGRDSFSFLFLLGRNFIVDIDKVGKMDEKLGWKECLGIVFKEEKVLLFEK